MHDDLLAIIEGMGDGVIVIDETGQVLVCNDAARRMMGYSPGEPVGPATLAARGFCRPDGTALDPSDYPTRRALSGESCDQVEIVVRRPGAEDRWISCTARPISLSSGRRGAVSVFRDVSHLKKVEKDAKHSDALYRAIAHNMPNGAVFLFDSDLRILAVHGTRLLVDAGLRAEDLVGRHVATAVRPANRERVVALYRATIAGESQVLETTTAERTYETHAVPIRDDSGAIVAGLAMVYDVTQHKKDAAEMRTLSAKVSTLIEHLSIGVLFEDGTGRVEFANRTFCDLFGMADASAIVGRPQADPIRVPSVVDPEAFVRLRGRRIDEGVAAFADPLFLGDGRVVERDYVPVNVAGVAEGHFWCFRDVTQRERARAQLAELSNRDELTGLYNRRGFMTLAEQWLRLAARTRRTPLLLFVDINGMKPINDRLGHAAGDQMLRDTADVLRATFRDSDILARLGGDEFVVLAVDAPPEHANILCARLDRGMREFNAKSERPYPLSFSVGVAAWDPAQPRSVEQLLADADARMYEAKRRRRANPSVRVGAEP